MRHGVPFYNVSFDKEIGSFVSGRSCGLHFSDFQVVLSQLWARAVLIDIDMCHGNLFAVTGMQMYGKIADTSMV